MKHMRHLLFLLPLLVLSLWSYLHAYDAQVWWTEMAMVFLLVPLYVWLDVTGRCRLSLPATAALFLWFYLQVVGACYTFERVPFDFIGQFFGCERNHYDRVAHFVVGVNAVGIAEILWQKRLVSSAVVAAGAAVIAIMALANFWELVEWLYAEWDGGTAGAAFLGSQGDVWDAQKDMLMDTLGALLGSGLFLAARALRPCGQTTQKCS